MLTLAELSTGEEQPVRQLLVNQLVIVSDWLDVNLWEYAAQCIGKR